MILRKEIEQLPVEKAKGKGSDRYVGRVRMHKDCIVMDVYDGSRLMVPDGEEKDVEKLFRWVCDGKNYSTYLFRPRAWVSQGMYYAMYGYSGWCSSVDIKLDQESKEIAKKFLESLEDKSGIYSCHGYANQLKDLEEHIRDQKRQRVYASRRERIEKRQSKRKPLPKDWDRFLDGHVFPKERYLFYDAKHRKIGKCAHCGQEVQLNGKQKHNEMGKCPHCGSGVQFKALGKTKVMTDKKQAIYLQKTEEGFLTRYITVWKESTPEGERYKSRDTVLATYNQKKTWYDYCIVSGFDGREFWDDSKPTDMSRWTATGYLYTRNVRQAVGKTEFRYAPLVQFMKHEENNIKFCDFMVKYQNSKFIEFFVKAGLFRLTKDYISTFETWHGNKPEEILKIDKQRMRRLINIDGGIVALKWLQYEQEAGKKVTDEQLEYFQENEVTPERCKEVIDALGSITRMVNYMRKQAVPPYDLVSTWNDYLRMASAEGMDITDDIVRFPKDLRLRHDQLVDIQTKRADDKREEQYKDLDKKIRERMPEVKRYFWENEKYMVIPAGTCRELMDEGRALHHCVGKDDYYMKKMAAGQSWICFLRKKESLKTPYYTLEIDMKTDKILQWYSDFDRRPDEKIIKRLLSTYVKNVRKNTGNRMQIVA